MGFRWGLVTPVVLGVALSSRVEGFLTVPGAGRAAPKTVLQAERRDGMEARRPLVQGFFVTLAGLGVATTGRPSASQAEVFFDPDRYGDKELKIATVNKLKQKLRNAVAEDNGLVVPFLRLAINDGLGFSVTTNEGGPDGSILFELDRPENAGLKKGLEKLIKIKQEVQSTNEITLADIVAFAGATSIEAVGGPRISVQLGRYDARGANDNPGAAGYDWNALSGSGIKATFEKSGLGVREAALLYGAVGTVHMATKAAKPVEEEEEDDFDEEQPFIPSTFGRAQDIYGAQIGSGKFDTTYLTTIMKGGSSGLNQLDKALMEDGGIKSFVQKYASNNNAYLKDLSEAYQRLTTLGFQGTTRNS